MATATEKRPGRKHRSKKSRRALQPTPVNENDAQVDSNSVDARSKQHSLPEAQNNSWQQKLSSPFAIALFSGILLWAAMPTFPGTMLSLLAWVAPVGWLMLIGNKELTGKRPLLQIYAASLIHCLLVYLFVRLPHWSANFGWVALSLYLALYPFAFVLLTRVAVHRMKLSVVLAAPLVWTGLELARGHLFSGLSTAILGHTQVHWNQLIQISDLAGAYAVSFLVMLVAACAYRTFVHGNKTLSPVQRVWPVAVAGIAIAGTLVYGQWRTSGDFVDSSREPLNVVLIQGSIDTVFPNTEQEYEEYSARSRKQYRDLSIKARSENSDLDLIIWPETMMSDPAVLLVEEGIANIPPDELDSLQRYQEGHPILVRNAIGSVAINELDNTWTPTDLAPVAVIAGMATEVPGTDKHFNSAKLIDEDGTIRQSYDKMHPVPFGEFIPFGNWIPALYSLAPIRGALTPGERAEAFEVAQTRIAPNVCFESIVPHLIRHQVADLQRRGEEPDVLLNITNDGWFWGSNLLDLHLTCNAFRAVELRKPTLVCANTGFSAEIDAEGRVIQYGPRRDTAVLAASVFPDRRTSIYTRIGDLPAQFCLLATILFGIVGLKERFWQKTGGKRRFAETNAT